MMCRTSIFALLAAAVTFAAEGVDNITVNASVDSRIDSVTVRFGTQSMDLDKGGSATWAAWGVGNAYSVTATGVATGYTAKWKVTTNGVVALSGNLNGTVTLSSTSFSGCALHFYGEPNTYTVTLDPQSGSGGSSSVTATYDAAMPSMGAIPTRQGYTFGGYYTAPNGGGTQYYTAAGASARAWNIANNTTLYAKWTARQYTLKVNPNGGSHGGHTAEYTVGNLVTGASSYQGIGPAARSGYTLAGFYDASTGGTKAYDGNGRAVDGTYWNGNYNNASFKGLADASATSLTVYAHWTTNQYTVTLDKQSGSGGLSSVRVTYDAAMPSMGAIPTRQGYTFGGYYTAPNGGGTQYYTAAGASARAWNIASNTTLYARWTARQYTLKVDPNGGTHDGHTAEYTVGNLVTGASRYQGIGPAARSGYTLAGFYDASTGGTKVYDGNGRAVDGTYWNGNYDNASFKGFANASVTSLTVHARWTAKTYTVTLDKQSGSGGSSSVTATYAAAMPTATMPTRTGYAFGGYYSAANGGGTQYYTAAGASARTWNIASNTTLYAKWTARQYTLKVNPNGGSHDGHTAEYARGDLITGTSRFRGIGAATRDGYTLEGFYDASTGGNKVYDGNGRAVDGTYWSGNYDAPASFKGLANASATVLTVYAHWTPKSYPVTFAIYGGTFLNGWTATTNYTLGVGLMLPTAADVSWTDHTFVGWYEDEAFQSDRVTRIGTSEMGSRSFYAKWTGKTYTVAFNANGGSGQGTQLLSMTDTGQNQLKTLAELRIKAPEGYTFSMWNTVADGSGDSFEDGAVIYNNLTNVANATVTLYAQWSPNPYEVVFQPNGADGGEAMPNQSFTYDVTQNLAHVAFTYTGHAFEKWSNNTNYNNQTMYYADGAAVANLATGGVVNLYANWTGIVYTVSFDANGGVGEMAPLLCTYTVPTNLPACAFTRDGWGFKGWTTNGADDVLFADRARVTNLTTTAEVTLLACWTGVTYAVTLDARDARGRGDGVLTNGMGVSVSVLTNSYVVGDAWDLPVPTNVNTHLSFAGWTYVDTNGVMNTLSESDVVPPPSVFGGTTNLMAAWGWVVDPLAAAVDAPDLEFSTFGTAGGRGEPSEARADYNWFAQANFVYGSTNAVQSAELPVNPDDSQVYVSWLTTTVETNGVLSFWWKCDAKPLIEAPYQQYALHPGFCGNSFTFGLYDSTEGITNAIAQLTDHVDWCCVVYTNKSDSPVTFAWAFAYADYAMGNGGGTGWVDRVTWKPEGSVSGEVTPTHKVSYSWLRTTFPEYASATAAALEDLAESQSPGASLPPGKAWPNGEPVMVWQDYWAGTDPKDPNDLFRADITVSNNVPYISWHPDLSVTGDPQRVYQVLCAPVPSAQEWVEWPGPGDSGAATNRFFKVKLILEEE